MFFTKEAYINSITDATVHIQTSPEAVPATPPWLGEAALLVRHLDKQGVLDAISEQVRIARCRFGHYEVIDFVAVLFGYAISGERTLETSYERLHPFAAAFMARFRRERLPARSTLSRFLTALSPEPVEALCTLFLSDGRSRPLDKEEHIAGLWDQQGTRWIVFASRFVISARRCAARPVGAARRMDLPIAFHKAAMVFVVALHHGKSYSLVQREQANWTFSEHVRSRWRPSCRRQNIRGERA